MAVPANEALIDLEDMLANPMVRQWNRLWTKKAKKIKAALKQNRWDEAHDVIDTIDYAPIAKKHLRLAETVGNASLLLGASRLVKKGRTEGGDRQEVLAHMLVQFEAMLSKNATERIQARGHRYIERLRRLAGEEDGIIIKAGGNPVVVGLGPIGTLGEGFAHLASNVHTSRLNSFGFMATALEQRMTHYQVSEVMDSRTCPVCREMDGKVFTVEQGARQAMQVMNNDDPDMIQHIAPWPSQSKGNVAQLGQMSANDMASNGLSLPPYHPACRGIVTTTTSTSTSRASNTGGVSPVAGESKKLAKGLIKDAKKVAPQTTKDIKATLVSGESRMEGLKYKVKGESSLVRKIDDAVIDGQMTASKAAGEMKDVLRYTVIADEGAYAATIDETLAALKAKGYKVTNYRNTWAKPGATPKPYQGVNTNLVTPKGQIFELQFHTKKSFNMKQVINHPLYEEARLKTTSVARSRQLTAKMIENQRKVPVPQGLQNLDDLGRLSRGSVGTEAPYLTDGVRTLQGSIDDLHKFKQSQNAKFTMAKPSYDDVKFKVDQLRESAKVQARQHGGAVTDEMLVALDTLTDAEIYALSEYTGNAYHPMNKLIWSKQSKVLRGVAKNYHDDVISALEKMPKFNGEVYRAGQFKGTLDDAMKHFKVGEEINHKAFTSTSRLREKIDFFFSDIVYAEGKVPIEFVIQSKSGRNISFLAAGPAEAEVLFRTKTLMKIAKVEMSQITKGGFPREILKVYMDDMGVALKPAKKIVRKPKVVAKPKPKTKLEPNTTVRAGTLEAEAKDANTFKELLTRQPTLASSPDTLAKIDAAFGGRVTYSSDPELFMSIVKSMNRLEVNKIRGKGSHYGADNYRIQLGSQTHKLGSMEARWIMRHETGHHLDAVLRSSGTGGTFRSYTLIGNRNTASGILKTTSRRLTKVKGAANEVFNDMYELSAPKRKARVLKALKEAGIKPKTAKGWDGTLSTEAFEDMKVAAAIETKDPTHWLANAAGKYYYESSWMGRDYFGSISMNKIGRGHPLKYYRRAVENQSTETMANYVAARGAADDTLYRMLRWITPEISEQFDDMIRQISNLKFGNPLWEG